MIRPVPSMARYWSINFAAFGVGALVAVIVSDAFLDATSAMIVGGLLPLGVMIVAALVQLRGTPR